MALDGSRAINGRGRPSSRRQRATSSTESTPPAGDHSAVDGADIADNPRGPCHRKLFPDPQGCTRDSTLVYSPPINTKKSRQFRQGDIHRARSKIQLIDRWRREGRTDEVTHYREEVRERLRAEGKSRQQAKED